MEFRGNDDLAAELDERGGRRPWLSHARALPTWRSRSMNSATRSSNGRASEAALSRRAARQVATIRGEAAVRPSLDRGPGGADPGGRGLELRRRVAHVRRAQCPGQPAGPPPPRPGCRPRDPRGPVRPAVRRRWWWGSWPCSRRGAPMCRSTRIIPPNALPSCSKTRAHPVLLTESELVCRLPSSSASVVCLDREWETIAIGAGWEPRRRRGAPQPRLRHLHIGLDRDGRKGP